MKLSENFTLAEATDTNGRAINNTPSAAQIDGLKVHFETVMQRVRDHFGPVRVNCTYRGPAYNAAVGGAKTSQHMCPTETAPDGAKGVAAASDFTVPGHTCEEVIAWMRKEDLPVDQVIGETRKGKGPFTWIHASTGPRNRKQYLQSFDGKTYKPLKL